MRFLSIDILRGIAVMLVLFRHFGIIDVLGKIGWAGVDLFFVISGFLVSGLLFKEYKNTNDVSASRFLIRRGFKIYPPFYLLILFTVLKSGLVSLLGIAGNKNFSLDRVLSEMFFVQNYFSRLWAHTWSLAVEEHFYLLLLVLIVFLVHKRLLDDSKLFWSIFIFAAIACLLLRWQNYYLNPFSMDTHFFYTHLRLDSLFFGVALSHAYHFNRDQFTSFVSKNKVWLGAASVLCLSCLVLVPVETLFMNTVGLTLIYVGFGLALIVIFKFEDKLVVASQPWQLLFIKPFSLVGYYSYSIYLWHIPILAYVIEPFLLPKNEIIAFLIYFFGCIATGIVASKIIEIPVLKFRDRKFPMLSKQRAIT